MHIYVLNFNPELYPDFDVIPPNWISSDSDSEFTVKHQIHLLAKL